MEGLTAYSDSEEGEDEEQGGTVVLHTTPPELELELEPSPSFPVEQLLSTGSIISAQFPTLDELLPRKTVLSPCSPALREKLVGYRTQKDSGRSVCRHLKRSKAFHNPDILEKLVTFVDISEVDSNYPKHIFNPLGLHPEDFYDELAKEQQTMYDKQEAAKQAVPAAPSTSKSNVPTNKKIVSKFSGTIPRPVVQHVVAPKTTEVLSNATDPDPKPTNRKARKWDQPSVVQDAQTSVANVPALPTDSYAAYVQEKKREASTENNREK